MCNLDSFTFFIDVVYDIYKLRLGCFNESYRDLDAIDIQSSNLQYADTPCLPIFWKQILYTALNSPSLIIALYRFETWFAPS